MLVEEIPPIDKTFIIRESGTKIIPEDWTDNYLFKYSIYYDDNLQKPLYEVFIDKDKVYQHPYIATTNLRFARIRQAFKRLRVNHIREGGVEKPEVFVELFNGGKFIIRDRAMIEVLGAVGHLMQNNIEPTYHQIENVLYPILSKYYAPESVKNIIAWITSILIGLKILDIEYNI